jgi:DNA mismatch repair protein MutS2
LRLSETELDLHGMTVDVALYELERFLNKSARDTLYTVWIIHGKGEGILRAEVGRHLKGHPLVKSYGLADYYHGGDGVTKVELDW